MRRPESCSGLLGGRLVGDVQGEDLTDPRHRDSRSLFDGERMLGRLKLDEGALTVISEVHHGLEVLGIRIPLEGRRKPPEERSLVGAMVLVVKPEKRFEVLRAYGGPDAPDEGLPFANDRDFEAATNKEELAIDYASIGI